MTFDEFLRDICPRDDLNWRKYRKARQRVLRQMESQGLKSFQEFRDLLLRQGTGSMELADLMRVTITRFFRERGCWDELAEFIADAVRQGNGPFRAWSVACCGGEEPFSLSILWAETIAELSPGAAIDIVATDIDDASLARAEEALYSASSVREVGKEMLKKWFERDGQLFRPLPEVRCPVRFRKMNLFDGAPDGPYDLVLCRYLPFTYYRGELLLKALDVIAQAVRPGGMLMIGRKESLPPEGEKVFAPVGKRGTLFVRG